MATHKICMQWVCFNGTMRVNIVPFYNNKCTTIVSWLKQEDEIIGTIDNTNVVAFTKPEDNMVVSLYARGMKRWSQEQFTAFLLERMVSRDRRDIERLLFRCGLSPYDIYTLHNHKRHPPERFAVGR